jgi:magnesium-transporting ATPase (P-type)
VPAFKICLKIPYFCNTKNGPVAEWLGKALQKLLHQFESGRDLTSQKSLSPKRGIFNNKKMVKILHWIGLAACILLTISCFMNWAYYPDLQQHFTGFYSEQNHYGKPAVFLITLAVIIFIFMLLPKIWAKRANLFLSALEISYAAKTYILFTSCYNTYCPQKEAGIYIMLFSTILIMLAAVFPTMKINKHKK